MLRGNVGQEVSLLFGTSGILSGSVLMTQGGCVGGFEEAAAFLPHLGAGMARNSQSRFRQVQKVTVCKVGLFTTSLSPLLTAGKLKCQVPKSLLSSPLLECGT